MGGFQLCDVTASSHTLSIEFLGSSSKSWPHYCLHVWIAMCQGDFACIQSNKTLSEGFFLEIIINSRLCNKPVLLRTESSESSIFLTSRYGTHNRWLCIASLQLGTNQGHERRDLWNKQHFTHQGDSNSPSNLESSMPPSVPTSTEKELGKDDYLQVLSPHPQLHSSCPDFASLQCPHVSTKKKAKTYCTL